MYFSKKLLPPHFWNAVMRHPHEPPMLEKKEKTFGVLQCTANKQCWNPCRLSTPIWACKISWGRGWEICLPPLCSTPPLHKGQGVCCNTLAVGMYPPWFAWFDHFRRSSPGKWWPPPRFCTATDKRAASGTSAPHAPLIQHIVELGDHPLDEVLEAPSPWFRRFSNNLQSALEQWDSHCCPNSKRLKLVSPPAGAFPIVQHLNFVPAAFDIAHVAEHATKVFHSAANVSTPQWCFLGFFGHHIVAWKIYNETSGCQIDLAVNVSVWVGEPDSQLSEPMLLQHPSCGHHVHENCFSSNNCNMWIFHVDSVNWFLVTSLWHVWKPGNWKLICLKYKNEKYVVSYNCIRLYVMVGTRPPTNQLTDQLVLRWCLSALPENCHCEWWVSGLS